ncbi:MAG: tRNA pseudouridine(55) synthase TruB [Elusimicrobia bacterium]|nr:tRNA pseudouridine(55) synthase TruB [Elusimicrobiota bacterium]
MEKNNGIYLVDKPQGWTSYQVVRHFQQHLSKNMRIGHTGTLDPMATGLLILLTGPCTKLQKTFQEMPKTYTGKILLGVETNTGDMDGTVLRRSQIPDISRIQLKETLNKFNKTLEVYPPDFSAVKYKGKPLYFYARKGIPIQKRLRKMTVYRWDLLEFSPPRFSFELDCGSGTYVRTLAELLGKDLGCGAVVEELRRTSIGPYRIEDAQAITSIKWPTLSPSEPLMASTAATRS